MNYMKLLDISLSEIETIKLLIYRLTCLYNECVLDFTNQPTN